MEILRGPRTPSSKETYTTECLEPGTVMPRSSDRMPKTSEGYEYRLKRGKAP